MSNPTDRELLFKIANDVGEVKGKLDALVGSPDSIIGGMQDDIDRLQTNDTILKWFTAGLTAVAAYLGFHIGKP